MQTLKFSMNLPQSSCCCAHCFLAVANTHTHMYVCLLTDELCAFGNAMRHCCSKVLCGLLSRAASISHTDTHIHAYMALFAYRRCHKMLQIYSGSANTFFLRANTAPCKFFDILISSITVRSLLFAFFPLHM